MAVILVLALVACGDDAEDSTSGKREVVASFYPLAEAARRVGGDNVEVTNLTPAGTEPHDLELDSDDLDTILDADLVLYVGGGFQPAVEDAVQQREGTSLDLRAGQDDPHFWLDPTQLARAAGQIADVLGNNADATTYQRQLRDLDREMTAGLRDCKRREIVTAHEAFHHLAERYDLTQHAIAGLSPEAEPDPDRLADLVDLVRDRGITTVFYETLVDPDVAKTLAREADVQTAVLDPIEGLTGEGKDYVDVMRANLAVLRKALDCR